MQTSTLEDVVRITGLGASGPLPELADKLLLFGQFVGDWEILEDRNFQSDGSEKVLEGELHWGWILDGRAVQDVWMFYDREAGRMVPYGTTVRFYDPGIDAWHSVWLTPEGRTVLAFIGRKVEDEIVLEGKNSEGDLLKWIFSEIAPNSFSWRGEKSRDAGKSWTLTETMKIRRKTST
jgi:hypothetical protein